MFAGANPLILLYRQGGDELVAVASLWQAAYTEQGAGHSLLMWVDPGLTGMSDPAATGIYSDNLPLARMLWDTFNRRWDPLLNHGLEQSAPQPARFVHQADGRRLHRVRCTADTPSIELLWQDAEEPSFIVTYPYEYEASCVILPCARASIIVNGHPVRGEVRPHDDEFKSSAVLAFCETWVARG